MLYRIVRHVVAGLVFFALLVVLIVVVGGYVVWKRRRGEEVKFIIQLNIAVASGVRKFRYLTKRQERARENVEDGGKNRSSNAEQDGTYNYAFDDSRTVESNNDPPIYEEVDIIQPGHSDDRRRSSVYDEPEVELRDDLSDHPSDWSDWSDDWSDDGAVKGVDKTRPSVAGPSNDESGYEASDEHYEVPIYAVPNSLRKSAEENNENSELSGDNTEPHLYNVLETPAEVSEGKQNNDEIVTANEVSSRKDSANDTSHIAKNKKSFYQDLNHSSRLASEYHGLGVGF